MIGTWGVRRHLALVLTILVVSGVPALAGDLKLKRVMLSTGGVGYFEHEAEVDGNAELTLDLPLDQVDDVLKSIVVYDSAGGVGSAQLPGREPLIQVFADLPFGADALDSPAALLDALQGAEITVGATPPLTGRLMKTVEETTRGTDGTTTTRHRVSLMTASGMQQFILEDAGPVRFTDAALQAKVDKALAAVAAYRVKDRRQLVLTTRGTGKRTVRVGYVVGAPLWKASFRLTLDADPTVKKAHLQGWAVLENMSGEDWEGVELTLLSGNPVSFRQAIYQAYYVNRPMVPVEVAGRILPPADAGTLAAATKTFAATSTAMSGASAAPLPMRREAVGPMGGMAPAPAAPPLATMIDTAVAQENETQVSFTLPVGVSLVSGHSAILPIVDRDVPVTRVDLYQPTTATEHPLASVRLANDSANGLPPGVLTLYERGPAGVAYVGDARLGPLPAGENRLLSYASDEKVKVAHETQVTSTIVKASISQGVLHLTRGDRQITRYRLAGAVNAPRQVILEQLKGTGWTLVDPQPSMVDQTADAWRVTVPLAAGESKTVGFIIEHPRQETLAIADFDDQRLTLFVNNGEIDPAIRKAFATLAQLRRTAADRDAEHARIKDEIAALTADQERLRENLRSVDRDNALHKRYLEKLAGEETSFENLQSAETKAAAASRDAAAAISSYIAGLTL